MSALLSSTARSAHMSSHQEEVSGAGDLLSNLDFSSIEELDPSLGEPLLPSGGHMDLLLTHNLLICA